MSVSVSPGYTGPVAPAGAATTTKAISPSSAYQPGAPGNTEMSRINMHGSFQRCAIATHLGSHHSVWIYRGGASTGLL